MNIAIVLRPLEVAECNKLVQLQRNSGIKIIADREGYVPEGIEDLKITTQSLPAGDMDEVYQSLLNRVVGLGHKVYAGKTIASILNEQHGSYWYYLRFALFHRSLNDFKVSAYIRIIQRQHPENAYIVYANGSNWVNLVEDHSKLKVAKGKSSAKSESFFLLKYSIIFIFRLLTGIFQKGVKRKSVKNLLVLSQDQQEVINLNSLKIEKADPHLSYLIDKVSKDPSFVFLSQLKPPGISGNHQLKWSSVMGLKYPKKTILFEPYLIRALFKKKTYRLSKSLRMRMGEIQKISKNASIEDQYLMDKLLGLKKLLYLAINREVASEILLKDSSLISAGGVNEHALEMRGIFNVCKTKGITTYGVQHGGISTNNVFYSFCTKDRGYNPWPDFTLLRGNYNKELLSSQNAIPDNSIKVLGHMRTDAISKLAKLTIKNVLPSVDSTSKIVIYATQGFPQSEKTTIEKQILDVLTVMKSLPDYHLIIKPHPNETDLTYYSKIAAEIEFQKFSFYESDLYLVLAIADVVITYYSTVGTEAVYFNKPLIVLDYQQRDAQGFLKSEVGFNVLNKKQLKEAIINPYLPADEVRSKYISDRAFLVDGKTTERYYQFISSLLK